MIDTPISLVVVIPTKNRRSLLDRALKSVLSQTYNFYRIVIINDGSVDDTKTYLDSITDSRIQVIQHSISRGVNAARNAAFRTLKEGEWAIPLDDDDMLLSHALEIIADAIKSAPFDKQILCFNTKIKTQNDEFVGGYQFQPREQYYDPTYFEMVEDISKKLRGDYRQVFKWSLFPKYLFTEDINGFEGEWIMLTARDNVGIRFVRGTIIWIDLQHEGEHLSAVAAKRNPRSFVRAHKRIFHAHAELFEQHPELVRKRSVGAIKLAIRALDPISLAYFIGWYMHALTLKSKEN